MGYGFSALHGRGVATPFAGLTRSGERETLRLGQRLKLGLSEWKLQSEFGEERRSFSAGYVYRLDGAFDFDLELIRREAANDDPPEHGMMLRARMRW